MSAPAKTSLVVLLGTTAALLAGCGGGACTPATSNSFNITHAAATKLGFGQQPTNVQVSQPISPAVTVRVEDR